MELSSIQDIHAAIESYNPFHTPAIVREQDVWEGVFLDVKTVNAHASDAVFQAIEQVQRDRSGRNKITSMVITAQRGVGKSHTLSRIHRWCQSDGKALFVYAGVEKYAINSINYEFQQTLAESLDRIGTEGVTQWQELDQAGGNK
jgi:tRNA(Met) C34 N-acetyltransferase TmcA